ncbi:antibiotic biosynthesis monooxygenase [Geodermatophilus sp. SYSU D00758]
MYARSNTVHGDPASVDAGIAHVRDEVMPLLTGMDGCIGLSMLADRETGRCIVTSAWRDEEAMHASAEGVRESRRRAAEVFGGTPEVREWEIAVLHRAHEAPEGACTRVTWTRFDPERTDEILDVARTAVLPRLEEYAGFCSASTLVSRGEGMGATAVTFTDRAAMEATREQARATRDELATKLHMAVTDVGEFDLVLAHLRVPETV